MKCRNCGAEIGENDKFCMACGTAVRAASETVDFTQPAEEVKKEVEAKPEQTATSESEEQTHSSEQQTFTQNVEQQTYANTQNTEQTYTNPQNTEQQTYTNPQNAEQTQSQVSQQEPRRLVLPKAYKPISMWGYFGYDLLFAIPIVGLICIIVFAFSSSTNKNLQNYARSKFCWFLIALVLWAIFFILVLVGGISLQRFTFGF